MNQSVDRFGLSCALVTPFREDGSIDLARLTPHIGWALGHGCDSVTLFGTTGEGPLIGQVGRDQMIGAVKGSGVDFRKNVVGGVIASSLHDALDQANQLLNADARALLVAPPFYFKGVSDDGLFNWFSAFITKLGDRARNVILYHIPSVTAVPLSIDLINRLQAAFPKIITGVKDSAGDWGYSQKLLAAQRNNLSVLIGDERVLAQAVRDGGQGAISGMANLVPGRLRTIIYKGQDDAALVELVNEVLKYPVTPAVKALVSHKTGDKSWLTVRAPLLPISAKDTAHLGSFYDRVFAEKAA
ncbi:dihydrodipicolinate synthase family protein [Lacibacterium aquatile]|uniref:Dihydrodipicolinate synthase family protein n=1 Tax=Lacibacterium aquatile TaxID=1168082 RepID=A0ABW5DKI2_9PROT